MTDVPPGWRAIDAALSPLYGQQRPRHYATLVPLRAGGVDPLHGVSAYYVAAPAPHWHLVSYGLTELFEKESKNPKVSGYGFELTLRLAGARSDGEPELWSVGLLQSLARYVYSTGRYFEPGHFFELPEPVAPDFPALAFVSDPELKVTTGPFGAFEFLQAVPLRTDEVRALKAWNTVKLLAVMAKKNPRWLFSPARPSVLRDAELAKEIADGTARDGSATSRLRVAEVAWRQGPGGAVITLSREAAGALGAVLRGRIPFGRPLEVIASEAEAPALRIEPGPAGLSASGALLKLSLSADSARALSAELEQGRRAQLQGVQFEVRG